MTIRFGTRHALDMYAPLLTVPLRHLSFTVVVMASNNHDLIISSYRHGAHCVLSPQILAERRAHQFTTNVRRRSEGRLARLAAGAADGCFHFPVSLPGPTPRGKLAALL